MDGVDEVFSFHQCVNSYGLKHTETCVYVCVCICVYTQKDHVTGDSICIDR